MYRAARSLVASSLADENKSASSRRENYNGTSAFAFTGVRVWGESGSLIPGSVAPRNGGFEAAKMFPWV